MKGLKQKRKKKNAQRAIFYFPAMVILLAATMLMAGAVWNIYGKARDTEKNLFQIANKHKELQEREASLAATVKELETPFGIESEIRDKFGLAKEGEEVIIIVDESPKESENEEAESSKGWWEKIKGWF